MGSTPPKAAPARATPRRRRTDMTHFACTRSRPGVTADSTRADGRPGIRETMPLGPPADDL